MSNAAIHKVPWSPPHDDELTWFPAKGKLPLTPSPLEYTVEVDAFFFGLTRALESLEFPLTEVRSRLVDGRLYVAVAPSADAEKDTRRRLQSVRDLSLRYTRDIRGFWQQQVQPKIEGYNSWMGKFVSQSRSSQELAEQFRQLRWVRGNQWFNTFRPVVAPTALMQHWANEAIQQKGRDSDDAQSAVRAAEDASAVTKEALGAVERGKSILLSALQEVGGRLTSSGHLKQAEDIYWLQWIEVRNTLENGGKLESIVEKRESEAIQLGQSSPPSTLGPPLSDDAPRMYLIREILDLLG
jgi:hypothetical protein